MTEVESTGPGAASRARFVLARLGSALGLAPLGVWTVIHLWKNLAVLQGADAWQDAVTVYAHPFAELATAFLVLVPLVVHAAWGVGRLFTMRPNWPRYSYFANFKYLLQRLSAIGLLLFLGAHVWLALLQPRLVLNRAEPFADLAHEMHYEASTLVVYLLGVLAIAFHLANGAHMFAMSWGIVATRRALRRLELFAYLAFFVLLVMGWTTVLVLWQLGEAY